jgi:PAP2 superfamily.
VVLFLAVCIPVQAQELPPQKDLDFNRSPFKVDLKLDLPITIGALALGGGLQLFIGELSTPFCGLKCDPSRINALDRTVLGNYSPVLSRVSDALVTTQIVLPHALGLLDIMLSKPSDGWKGQATDSLVLVETVSLNLCLNNIVKLSVGRPRPYVYDSRRSDAERLQPDAATSFYSLHTSTSFAMATAYSYLFTHRHPDSPWVVPIWIGTHGLAAITGVLRVESGQHFWTDVIMSALVGSGIGLLVPYLHTHHVEIKTDEVSSQLTLSPLVYRDGFGLMMTWH